MKRYSQFQDKNQINELVDSSENSSNDYPVIDTQQNTQQEDFSHPSITDFEQVSKIYDYILQQSKKLNMRPLVIFNSMDLKEPLKSKVEALVHIHQEDELNESTWTAQDLKTATEKAKFFTEEWNKIIQDAKDQQMDVGTYVSMHYPEALAKEIYTWYQIKTGQLKPFDINEKLAVTVNEISNEEIQQYDEQYDDLTFQQFVENAREALSEINWQKVGAYLSDGVNNVIYQLSKPGSFIKKTADSIRAVVSLLSLKNVDEFSEQYDKEQENKERAEQELDEYLAANRTSHILRKMIKVANYLDDNGKYKEATEITGVMKRIAQPLKPKMNDNEIVYQVLKNHFGPDYNKMKDLKIKVRDNYSTLVSEIQALAQQSNVNPQKAALRLKQVMDAASWHSEAKRPPMYGQGGGTSVYDPTQRTQPSAAESNYIQGNSLVDHAIDWISKNGEKGAEFTMQKAIAQNKAGKMSHKWLNEIIALLKPRVDAEKNRQKALQGTAAGALGSFNRNPKPYAVGD